MKLLSMILLTLFTASFGFSNDSDELFIGQAVNTFSLSKEITVHAKPPRERRRVRRRTRRRVHRREERRNVVGEHSVSFPITVYA